MSFPLRDDAFLSGGGEMGALVREIDWTATPLGAASAWPQSLRTSVSLCLMSRFPMAVCWGAAYAIIYNDAYRPILGTKHPWAMGRPCFEVWDELAHIVKPMFDGVIETGVATWSDDLMLPMLRHGYLEEAYFTVSYSAIRGESEQPEGILVTVTETTERYLAERRLQVVRDIGEAAPSARSLDDVAEVARSVLARHNADIPFAALYAVDEESGEARLTAAAGVRPGDAAAPARISFADRPPWPLDRALKAGQPVVVDNLRPLGPLPGGVWPEPAHTAVLLPIAGAGTRGPVAVLVAGVNPRRALDDAHLEFFQLVARQIANAMANAVAHEESRRRAEALAELDRAKTAFFSNVSHEFRTPLTLMLGPLQDALAAPALPPPVREHLDVAQRNAARLLKLVNSLLDFARIEAGRINASYEETDLAVLTAELASVFRSAVERAGLRLVVNCAATADAVFVDREMWEKIVLNLLSNAFKFTFDGEIEVTLRQVRQTVELVVRDTGTGIAVEDLPHIFQRFHRVRNARSRSFEGTGIGLALVQELVKLHGGTVSATSDVGHGTTFVVSMPVGSAHLPAERIGARRDDDSGTSRLSSYTEEALRWLPSAAAGSTPVSADRPLVLVVDDNADMRAYVSRLLASTYDVVTAADGLAALQAIRERRPDLVLSDVMMPRLDGFELLTALRREPDTRDLPILLLSARAGEEARVEGLGAGATDYLVKPFSASELMARVGSTLQLTRLRREGEERLAAANRDLQRHLDEHETLLDVLPIGIGIAADRECRDIRINRAFAASLGLRPDANASKTAPGADRPENFRVLTPDGVEIPDDQLPLQVAAREGREVNGVEFDIVHDDGRIVRLLEYAAPLFDEKGTPRGAVGAFVDISAAEEAKRTLARSEERYRRIFDTAGVSIWEQDFTAVVQALERLRRDGVNDLEDHIRRRPEFVAECLALIRVVDVNAASLRMFAAAGKGDLVGSLERILGADARQMFAGALLALARGDRRYEGEAPLRTLDGRQIHALMSMTFPPAGAPLDTVLLSIADITDRKLAENALRRSETLFRDMADTAPVMLWTTDALGQCTFLSRGWYEFTGHTPASDLRAAWMEPVHPEDREQATARFAAASSRCEPFRLEYRLRRADGEYRWAIDAARPRLDEHGACLGYIGAVIDISERKAAETALEQASRLKDEFLATLSHELRTPLNAVLDWAHMLREGTMKPSMHGRALESLERNARAQAQLVDDLLDVSRIISGKLHIRTEPVDLETVITNAVETVRAGASAKQLDVRVQLPADHRILVTGDPDRLQQIVWNLVSNAIKFTPSGGRVEVALTRRDGRAEIAVRDTGPGIAPEFQPYLFERFRQMDATAGRRHGGLGLGLSIVRHLSEAHGGSVTADSAGEGRGSTFRVQLPLRAVTARDAPPGARQRPASAVLKGVRALVVDDEEDARELIRYALEAHGADVATAASAGEALHRIGLQPFDLLVADIGMPEQDGYELIRALRGMPAEELRSLPAIAVTAYTGAAERDLAYEAGYDRHLVKPVDPDQLVAAVSAAARRTRAAGRSQRKRSEV